MAIETRRWTCSLFVVLCVISAVVAEGSDPVPILTRVIWQDDDAKCLRCADLLGGDPLQLGPVTTIAGFPKLDAKRQTLVQMEAAQGLIMVGVRDDDGGAFQSGWVLVDAGVEQDDHGDHSHWHYTGAPRVRAATLDDRQGNPAHLYCYDDAFFVANDKLNGFTHLDPRGLSADDQEEAIRRKAAFHRGGGGHITMAAVDRKYAFSSWIDRDGPNKGRVDMTLLSPQGANEVSQSFTLPHGGIHGATANSGKVFFAPSEGICWFEVPPAKQAPKIHHISLGKDGERPRRTGAFSTYEHYVAFTTGAGQDAAFCFLDARLATPEVTRHLLKFNADNRPSGLEFVKPRKGSPLAFVFQDHAADLDDPYFLAILELDPNGDGNWQDVKVAQELTVGKAKVDGHYGHHGVAFDAHCRHAIVTNPGDGTMELISLRDRKQVAKFHVGGMPSKVIAIGGRSSRD